MPVLMLLVVALKYLIPVVLVWFPFAAGWSNFILDSVDGDILVPLGLDPRAYQFVDKSADYVTYVFMVVAGWRWPVRKWIIIFFAIRTVGQAMFFLTENELSLAIFPNLLEPLFLAYATVRHVKKAGAPAFFAKHATPLWILIVVYKAQDEVLTHVLNIDRTEMITRLFGG